MATPILYTFRRCPFAIRARAALYFSTTKVEIREVVLKNKPIDMLKASKKGTVPILVLKNKVLDERIEIIIWALKNYDALNLLNPYEKDKKNTLNIISKIDNEFKYHLDRYKYSSRFKEDIDFKGKYEHRKLAEIYLNEIEDILSKKKYTYLYENKISIIDLCIFPLVRQFKITDEDWFNNNAKLINLNKWLNRIINLDFFNEIMKKYKPWKKNNSPEFFPSNLKI